MSLEAIIYVWKHSKQRGSALLLMLALADYADENGYSYPSVGTLARKTRMGERNVQKLLQKLQTEKEIVVKVGDGVNTPTGATNLFQINGLTGVNASTPRKKRGERQYTPQVNADAPPGVNASTPKPQEETQDQPQDRSAPDGAVDTIREEINPSQQSNTLPPDSGHPPSVPPHIALIDAWLSALPAKPAVKDVYKRYCGVTAPMADAGITPEQVKTYTQELRKQDFWKGKLVTLEYIAANIGVWIADSKPAPRSATLTATGNAVIPEFGTAAYIVYVKKRYPFRSKEEYEVLCATRPEELP